MGGDNGQARDQAARAYRLRHLPPTHASSRVGHIAVEAWADGHAIHSKNRSKRKKEKRHEMMVICFCIAVLILYIFRSQRSLDARQQDNPA